MRLARIAAGGPARLPKGESKGGKGAGGKAAKGKGHGGAKGHSAWPTRQQWGNYYPGPSQSQWKTWYPQQNAGKMNLFQQPFQLSSIQDLFQPGNFYSLVEKGTSWSKARVENKDNIDYGGMNRFDILKDDADDEDEAYSMYSMDSPTIPPAISPRNSSSRKVMPPSTPSK